MANGSAAVLAQQFALRMRSGQSNRQGATPHNHLGLLTH
jgi:hypothetical protein